MTLAEKKIVFTYEDLLHWENDQKRHELIKGDHFMTPSPSYEHQRIAFKLAVQIELYVQENQLGDVFVAPVDVVLSDYDVLVPDIGFVRAERLTIIADGVVKGAPDLVVEVLSPSSLQRDKSSKFKQYSLYGVKEYWIVDPDKQTIEVHDLEEQKRIAIFGSRQRLNSPTFPDINLEMCKIF